MTFEWQNEIRELVQLEPLHALRFLPFLIGFLVVSAIFILIGKSVTRLYNRCEQRLKPVGAFLVSFGVVILSISLASSLLYYGVQIHFRNSNGFPYDDLEAPTTEFKSAGPGSAVEWDTVGRHGSLFLGAGPSAQDIEDVTGREALEPIRVYAGMKTAPTAEERAEIVVDELLRTGAFDREILVVATTTGSGWLEPQTVDSLECLYGGDTAIAAIQYAFVPSWVSFLFDPELSDEASAILFEAVEDEWLKLPEDDRPELIVYGLSLGASGSQAAFADLDDLRSRTDGALFVGTPNASAMWQELQNSRDPGSPMALPVLDNGQEVRWMSRRGDVAGPTAEWEHPVVLYLQHATDPVTWFSSDLFFQKPEWLDEEQRSEHISTSMRWIPIITGLQVAVDLLGADQVPAHVGHNYGDVIVPAWINVLGDPGLPEETLQAIQDEIETYATIIPFDQ